MIPLYKPYITENITKKLDTVLKSGKLMYGTYGKKLEEALANFLDNKNTLVINNYTTALSLIIYLLDLQYGDEIIMSPLCCLRSVMPFINNKCSIIWADINPCTGTLDPDSVKSKITKKTKLIFHNQHLGYVGYIEKINTLGDLYEIPVINDCIDGIGIKYNNKYIDNGGSFATVFSMDAIRIPNAIDGAGIVFKDSFFFEKCKKVRDLGIDRSTFRTPDGEISETYHLDTIGYAATLNEINSCIALEQMSFLDALLKKRQENMLLQKDKFSLQNNDLLTIIDNTTPNFWILGCLSKNPKERDSMIKYYKSIGYAASKIHINNNRLSILGINNTLKGVDQFYSTFYALPCGWWIND